MGKENQVMDFDDEGLRRRSSALANGGALSGGGPHLTVNAKDAEIEALREEIRQLKTLNGSQEISPCIIVKSEDGPSKEMISAFQENENEAEDAWWDVFSLAKRTSVASSPIANEIREKYQGYGIISGFNIFMDNFFHITQRKTSFFQESYAGVTTFFAMAYIIALNPIIIAGAIGEQYKAGIFFSTCLASGFFTIMMGLFANLPVALAPGMGLNGYFANVARVAANGALVGILTWQQGMAAVFTSGLIYLFMTASGLRFLLFKAVPMSLRHAMSAGIGLFICTIGYKIGCILGISYYGGPIDTFTAMIPFYNYDITQIPLSTTPQGRITVLGLMWVALFISLGFRAGILCAIVMTTFCGISGNGLGEDSVTSLQVFQQNPIPFLANVQNVTSAQLDFSAVGTSHFWDVTWTFVFVEMFDSFGTLSTIMIKSGIGGGVAKKADRAINNAMLIDGWGLLLGSVMGSNSITPFVESLTGIVAGARSGLASIVTGTLFLLSLLFVYPFIAIIPDSATVPALFMVGVYSISEVCHVDWDDFPTAFSSFMIVVTMPLTYSIANGIAAGFIFYNFTVTVRWLGFRFNELTGRTKPGGKGAGGRRPWESGWNADEPKDFLPHWVMMLFGVFMCFRYRYFM